MRACSKVGSGHEKPREWSSRELVGLAPTEAGEVIKAVESTLLKLRTPSFVWLFFGPAVGKTVGTK
jgi:hypothetical protein